MQDDTEVEVAIIEPDAQVVIAEEVLPPAPITTDALIQACRLLQQRIPGFDQLTAGERQRLVRVSSLDPEFLTAGIEAMCVCDDYRWRRESARRHQPRRAGLSGGGARVRCVRPGHRRGGDRPRREVRNVRVLKPLPFGVDQAAADAVKQWKFSPGTRNGEAVDVFGILTLQFKSDGSMVKGGEVAVQGGVLGGVGGPPQQRAPLTTAILVRHAEKGPTPADDPPLTAHGLQRAESLARMLANTPITAIYTTPYARTRETAAPLAAAKRLTPVEVAVGRTYPYDIVPKVHEQRGGTFVVVGHSDTTRDVLRAFGFVEAKDIPDSEYDNLYIATYGPLTEMRVLSLKY